MTRNAHTLAQREFIVRRLAAFETPKDITAVFAVHFSDTSCTIEDVLATDPRCTVVAPELHALFYTERARVMTDPNAAPYAEQRARMIVLSRQVDYYESNNQRDRSAAVLRQIADEMGIGASKGKGGATDMATPDVKHVTVKRTVVYPEPAK